MSDAGIVLGPLCLLIIVFILFEIFIIWFWISTLVECVKKETFDENARIVWIIVIATTGAIGALIYVLARRPERIRLENMQDYEKVYVKEYEEKGRRMEQMREEGGWRYTSEGFPLCPRCGVPLQFSELPMTCPYCGTGLYR
ncbi:MAG: hypothetical protein ACMUHM_06595 [Thermoplasmatota archaeon]